MEIDVASECGAWRVVVRGELDMWSAPLLGVTIDLVLAGRRQTVIVDLAGVSFIDAAGLHALLSVTGPPVERPRWVSVGTASPIVERLLQLANIDEPFLPRTSAHDRRCGAEDVGRTDPSTARRAGHRRCR